MKPRLSKIGVWVLGSVAVLALVFGAAQYQRAQAADLQIEASRQRAVFSLISHVENIEASLAKARAASTPGQQTTFLTNCWSHSSAAVDNLAQLSMANVDLTSIRQFVSRVGDYSHVLAQKASRGSQITQAEWQELQRLETSVKDLARGLLDMGRRASATKRTSGTIRGFLSGIVSSVWSLGKASQTGDWLTDGFSEIGVMTQSVPAPVYDGPFSDVNLAHATLAHPGPAIDAEMAKRLANDFLAKGEVFESVRVEENSGAIPSFLVTQKRSDGTEVTVAVAKQGGAVLWAADSRRPGPTTSANIDQAREAARAFLNSKSLTGMVETGWRKPGSGAGRVVFAFVPETMLKEDGEERTVRLYPDLVKVEVGLDGGSVLSFDQIGYLTKHNHPSRSLKAPLISESEARVVLRKDLTATDEGRLSVIPLLASREVLAWEFRCQAGEDTYLVYINAMDGNEEAIFQVITDSEGSLTV
ncbi:MAG: PepSY1/2 domain-containing protein [Bacillota bacterium]|jgi:spore germination protein